MIRFLDTDVLAVQKAEIDRAFLRHHFFVRDHMDDILIVYENGQYCGIVTYYSYLKSVDEEGYIFQEKYIQTPDDDNMWRDLKGMFERLEDENTLIPIVNGCGEILYFAYEDRRKENEFRQDAVNRSLDSLEKIESSVLWEFLSDVYPKVRGIRIYNLNEWGYRLGKILERCGYYVDTVGEKWEVLYPCTRKLQQERETLPEMAFMNIYAEGTYSVWSR